MANNNFFEELQKLTTGALNTVADSAKNIEETFKSYVEATLRKMDFVKREELEIVKEALTKSIEKQKELEAEIDNLKKINKKSGK